MSSPILYAGDSHLRSAAAYLAGVLTHAGLPFDYVASDAPMRPSLETTEPRLYVLSDYPVKNLTDADFGRIIGDVERGSGLLMIGGMGIVPRGRGRVPRVAAGGGAPVACKASDDRVNAPQPCMVEKRIDHPILNGLPLAHPPGIGGYNRVRPKADAEVLLSARHDSVEVRRGDDQASGRPSQPHLHARGAGAAAGGRASWPWPDRSVHQ